MIRYPFEIMYFLIIFLFLSDVSNIIIKNEIIKSIFKHLSLLSECLTTINQVNRVSYKEYIKEQIPILNKHISKRY